VGHYVCRLALALSLASFSASAGSIAGRIHVTKRLTKRRVTPIADVYKRGVSVAPEADERSFLEMELSRVAVYIDGVRQEGPPQVAELTQKSQQFQSDVVVIPAGSTVSFPNLDPIFHNVFSLSPAKSFDLGNYKQNETRTVTFPKPGIVQVYCHLHPNMSAAIVVTPNAWAAQPNELGFYELRDVPDGKYHVTVWHRSAGFFHKDVEVKDGAAKLDFVIPVDVGDSSR
jgi:plastocyanin